MPRGSNSRFLITFLVLFIMDGQTTILIMLVITLGLLALGVLAVRALIRANFSKKKAGKAD